MPIIRSYDENDNIVNEYLCTSDEVNEYILKALGDTQYGDYDSVCIEGR